MCENIDANIKHLLETVIHLWQKSPVSGIFMPLNPHLPAALPDAASCGGKMNKKEPSSLCPDDPKAGWELSFGTRKDVTHFCRMFDYRNKDSDWGNSKDAIERSIQYITSRQPKNEGKADEKNR